jgi:ADP-ribose pyrophosphatase YjhB (NUDIX family)
MVRGLVINDSGEVLLMKMSFPWLEVPVWIAPGGGLEAGETEVEALRRELHEETGRVFQIGPPVWERRFVVEHRGRIVQAHERYFVVRSERFVPNTRGLEEHERRWFREFGWWEVDALLRAPERTSPETLASLVARVVADLLGPPGPLSG